MWTNTRFFIDAEEVEGSHLLGYRHPREIVADESLSVARRRALLAHWLSDRHAVRDVPGLRSISTGVTASVDDLQAALCALDETEAMVAAGAVNWHPDALQGNP